MPKAHNPQVPDNWIGPARNRLAARRAEKPVTKAGQIQALWPDIEAAVDAGQSLKSICEWLQADAGITLSAKCLASYISRLRRRRIAKGWIEARSAQPVRDQSNAEPILASLPARTPVTSPRPTSPAATSSEDPLAQAMRAISKPTLDIREIHNDGDPRGRKLI